MSSEELLRRLSEFSLNPTAKIENDYIFAVDAVLGPAAPADKVYLYFTCVPVGHEAEIPAASKGTPASVYTQVQHPANFLQQSRQTGR
jgi:hypothetical protein